MCVCDKVFEGVNVCVKNEFEAFFVRFCEFLTAEIIIITIIIITSLHPAGKCSLFLQACSNLSESHIQP